MGRTDKPLIWLRSEVKTPPFSQAARLEAGYLLRLLQEGEALLDVLRKKTQQTPQSVIENCRRRLREYDRVMGS
ncbi:MAG: hypothetical protein LZF62_340159 [Nitrospira sp.]|nr:MAG: hypothetical protein LZF62_340159 [Nitrospira sp.]